MASNEVIHDLRRMPGNVTLRVIIHETTEFKLRTWLAMQLFRLGAWVWGCGINFDEPEGDE